MLINIDNKKNKLEFILDKIARDLQLNKARRERMESAYKGVSECIQNDEEFFKEIKFDIYPQGSVLIGTTVKPVKKDEYDLDIVVQLMIDWQDKNISPFKVYNELERVLKANKIYEEKLEPKNRVLRLNYAGDFHMDIMPGVQENINDINKIRIPDKEKKRWKSSNPKGYGEWFDKSCEIKETTLLEGLYSKAEPLPDQATYEAIPPLKRAVQLIKRYRDIYYQEDDKLKVSSIILTTIAGQFYKGNNSIVNTIKEIVDDIYSKFVLFPESPFDIPNPVNKDENFADKWKDDIRLYHSFKKFIINFKANWDKVEGYQDLNESKDTLSGLFGENYINEAFSANEKYTNHYQNIAKQVSSAMSGGYLTVSGIDNQKKHKVEDKGGFYGKV